MYPKNLTEDIRSDKKRKAELKVYYALKKTLTDGFHVFYNCSWSDQHQGSNRDDGEADFIIAHEKFGYIVLEVKGGVISRDENRQWYTTDSENKKHKIKNPVEQAKTSKHVIFRKLKDILGKNIKSVRKKHAVVLPGSSRHQSKIDLGADMPRNTLMFLEDIPNLGSKVEILLSDTSRAAAHAPFGKAGIDGLIKLFNQSFSLNPARLAKNKLFELEIEEATNRQKKILKLMKNNNRVLISGGAGTGKTFLAIEKAKLLAKLGYSVLFLCFNIPLCKYLDRILTESENIHVHAHNQFCEKLAKDANIPLPDKSSDENKYWGKVTDVFLEALEKNPEKRYDAIIVDEGQDFKDEWLESLEYCLKDSGKGFLYIFYDNNQRLYHQNIDKLQKIAKTSCDLFENVRNTIQIFTGAGAFYHGGTLECLGPDGDDIEWIEAEQEQRDRKLEKVLNTLIITDGIAKSEIAVLTGRSYKNYENFSVGKHEFCRADDINSDYVVLDSIRRFKGLEKEAVILIDLNVPLKKNDLQLLYVGFSRPRCSLFVIDDTEAIKGLKSKVLCKK